jgi:hypothetical protein
MMFCVLAAWRVATLVHFTLLLQKDMDGVLQLIEAVFLVSALLRHPDDSM